MIKERVGKDKAIRVCDECGHEAIVSYWNLKRYKVHHCYPCSNRGRNAGRTPWNKGKRQEPRNIGNTYESSDSYLMVWVGLNNSNSGYMPLHRLLVADKIGRPLTDEEKVHHIDGQKQNNNDENLYVCKDMKHHRDIHAQLERLAFTLIQTDLIEFDSKDGEYKMSRPIKELVEEKSRELLGSPEKENQQPSSAQLAEKVQRLFRKEVGSSDSKRETPGTGDDIVCSIQ